MARSRKRALFIDTESTYGTDPDADGSDYVRIPTTDLSFITDGRQLIDTNYFTGYNWPTAPILGADGWEFTCTFPLIGMATAAGDGVNASTVTDDWFDQILTHIFGTQTTITGEALDGVNNFTSATAVELATDQFGVQALTPVFEASIPTAAARSQWQLVTVDNGDGTYTVAPGATDFGSYTGSAVFYGTKTYTFDDDGGASLSFAYVEDDVTYSLLGGRCTAASISVPAQGLCTMTCTFAGDSQVDTGKGSLDNILISAAPAITPCTGMLSPFWFDGTQYATSSIEIDLGLSSQPVLATQGANGRSDYQLIGAEPVITVTPLRTDALLDLKRAGPTTGRLLVQLGGGVLSGGVLNTCALHCEDATAMEVERLDDDGQLRQTIQFKTVYGGAFSASVDAKVIQFGRA